MVWLYSPQVGSDELSLSAIALAECRSSYSEASSQAWPSVWLLLSAADSLSSTLFEQLFSAHGGRSDSGREGLRVLVTSRLQFRGQARHPLLVLRQPVSYLPPRRLGTGEHMQIRAHDT